MLIEAAEAQKLKQDLAEVEELFSKLIRLVTKEKFGPKEMLIGPGMELDLLKLRFFVRERRNHIFRVHGVQVGHFDAHDDPTGLTAYLQNLAIYFLMEFRSQEDAEKFASRNTIYSKPLVDFSIEVPADTLVIREPLSEAIVEMAYYLETGELSASSDRKPGLSSSSSFTAKYKQCKRAIEWADEKIRWASSLEAVGTPKTDQSGEGKEF